MRIVLDTNVLVSGLLSPHGKPGRVVDLVTSGRVQLLFDDRIMSEYRAVLARARFGFDPHDVAVLLAFVAREGEALSGVPLSLSLPDPDDLPFVEVAAAGHAAALVTGNTSHFAPVPKAVVCVRSPADFLTQWRRLHP